MGVGSKVSIGSCNQQSPGHAEVHNPLRARSVPVRLRRPISLGSQFAHNVFSSAMDSHNGSPFQALCLAVRRRFERFAVRSKPSINNPVAPNPRMDAARNRLHLR